MSVSQKHNPSDRPDARKRSRTRKRKQAQPFDKQKLLGPLPITEEGQRLAELFPNGWNWIYTQATAPGEKPDWETIRKYPLAPVELWSLHQDENCIIGIRPNKLTKWGILDLDAGSNYHPTRDPEALTKILNALEDIGIVRSLLCQSSHSGGLHLYIPLPENIGSFGLALALKLNLEAAGIKLRSGQLETFPNVKRYIPRDQGYSNYNGIRLPFQPNSGFMPLDLDLNPLLWSIGDWLDAFDRSAQAQDLEKLKKAIADAEINYRIRGGERTPHSLENWQERIDTEKQGWTGAGESNEKFKLFACEARVFMGMDSIESIAAYIEETALNTPGFLEHSHHVPDLKQRAKDVAAWAMKYYWPLGGPSDRTTGYHSQQKAPADFSYHQAKREAAQHRIREAIGQLQRENGLPETTTARAKAIVQLAKISQHTLYKDSNKPLWHPDYFPTPAEKAKTQTEQDITHQTINIEENEPTRSSEPLLNKEITGFLFKVRFVIVNYWREALEALALKGQSASTGAIDQPKFEERGESEGGSELSDGSTPLITDWDTLRLSLPIEFQEKLARTERERRHRDELEQKRQQRKFRKQQRRVIDSSPEAFAQLELEIREQSQASERQSVRKRGNPSEQLSSNSPRLPQDDLNHSQLENHPSSGKNLNSSEETFRDESYPEEVEVLSAQDSIVHSVAELPSHYVTSNSPADPLTVENSLAGEGRAIVERSPYSWEEEEFTIWFGYASQFGLVDDSYWDGQQYWVAFVEQVWPFAELAGAFTVGWLRSALSENLG